MISVLFSVSTIQFSFTPAAKRKNSKLFYLKTNYLHFLLDISFSTEIWSLFLVFLVQDFSFFIVRIIILATVNLSQNYMIYFLVCKNFLLILIELYRIYVIYTEENKKRHEKNENFKKRFRKDTSVQVSNENHKNDKIIGKNVVNPV